MMDIKEVCGFKDSDGKFWDTKEEVILANERQEVFKLKEKINLLLMEAFRWPFFDPHYITDIRMGDLSNEMVNYPEKFLTVLWEITRYNFNKKFNES